MRRLTSEVTVLLKAKIGIGLNQKVALFVVGWG